jgi:bifunctional N-acetylglucosamine-1-phosphate-uridyltransferase/glucosamine-1-phosphate-acetyltransferase GlmU-like protein
VTDDVPDGALAVARARQENVAGYAERAKAERQERRLHSEER